jgi:hypothetical protein
MPSHMESSSNKQSDNRIPRRPDRLVQSRDLIKDFRDDTFLKFSPLEIGFLWPNQSRGADQAENGQACPD